jgi:uridine kinase
MTKIVLVTGLPNSGKTTLCNKLFENPIIKKKSQYINGNDLNINIDYTTHIHDIRCRYDLSNKFIIVEDIAPLKSHRTILEPDIIIFMDTINTSDIVYEKPTNALYTVKTLNDIETIYRKIWLKLLN